MSAAAPLDKATLARVREAAGVIAPLAERIEAERRLPPEAVSALASAGVFKLGVSRELGGRDASAATFLGAIEEIARADGSAGWATMIGATSSLMSAFLDEAVAREVYGPADAISCGVFAPTGTSTREGVHLRVRGRWSFASGCEHSPWRMVGTVLEGQAPLPSGAPNVTSVLLRAEDTRIVDTWSVSGLRGTGSHDLVVDGALAPLDRTFSLFSTEPRRTAEVHWLPFFGLLAAGVASVSLGIARAAIGAFLSLAQTKTPLGSKRGVAHRELVQVGVANAEAKVRGARAFLHEAVARAAEEAGRDGKATLEARALLRLAACHAASECAAAVDLVYTAAGGTAIYATSPLQRHFRDVHVATQHVMVGATSVTLAGRVLLGLESDTSTL